MKKKISSSNHLRPSFDPKQQQDKSADTTTKTSSKSIIKPRLPLNTEYNTTKLMYRASNLDKRRLPLILRRRLLAVLIRMSRIERRLMKAGRSLQILQSSRDKKQQPTRIQLILHPHQQQQRPSRD